MNEPKSVPAFSYMTPEQIQLAIRHYNLDIQRQAPIQCVWEKGDTDNIFSVVSINQYEDGSLWLTLNKTGEVVNPPGS